MKSNRKIVIAGGGTGGHVYPALAIAKGLVESGIKKDELIFYGSKNKIESELVPKNGYTLITLSGSGLNKKEYLENIIRIFIILFSCIRVFVSFVISRPKIVIGVGGYASVAPMVSATLLNINRIVHEQNAYMGRTNRLAQKFGAKVLTTFENTVNAKDDKLVGMPLLNDFEEEIRLRQEYLSLDHKPNVVITGGSMGSVVINNIVCSMVEKYYEDIDFSLVHVSGKNNYLDVQSKYSSFDIESKVKVFDYVDNISKEYALSDCVVSRGGAGTCVELDILNVNCIVIPLPTAPGDHQRLNAKPLAHKGQAIIIDQIKLSTDNLYDTIVKQLSIKQKDMVASIHQKATKVIARYIMDVIGEDDAQPG